MGKRETAPNDTKKVFSACGTCSQTFFHLLNREFGCRKKNEELAADHLAGGLRHRGFQCGMLWGSALAVGAESFRRYGNGDRAIAGAVRATRSVMESFERATGTHNCREIVQCDLTRFTGMMKLMFEAVTKGFNNFRCFNIAEQWTGPAIEAAKKGLDDAGKVPSTHVKSCATEVLKRMGASEEEAVTVAGLAGGMGLSGNACGALGAVIWKRMLETCNSNPGKKPPYFKKGTSDRIISGFMSLTDSELLCHRICGKKFSTLEEHADFIQNGGCGQLIDALARLN